MSVYTGQNKDKRSNEGTVNSDHVNWKDKTMLAAVRA